MHGTVLTTCNAKELSPRIHACRLAAGGVPRTRMWPRAVDINLRVQPGTLEHMSAPACFNRVHA
jgi:hypothetical protein